MEEQGRYELVIGHVCLLGIRMLYSLANICHSESQLYRTDIWWEASRYSLDTSDRRTALLSKFTAMRAIGDSSNYVGRTTDAKKWHIVILQTQRVAFFH